VATDDFKLFINTVFRFLAEGGSTMKLNMMKRLGEKKAEVKAIRREGNIPSILYSSTRPTELITINGTEFATCLRSVLQGRLATTVFTLSHLGAEVRVIVKDIQYHPTTYQVLHLDFVELVDGVNVKVKVPVECTGIAECSGIKLGGFLRQVIRYVQVECNSNAIPVKFEVDIRDLTMRQTRRIADIAMPTGVKAMAKLDEVVVVIAKR
jgi:large subunit ribosomal protein L25